MQEIKVLWEKTMPVNMYSAAKPQFSFLAPPLKDGSWPQVTNFHGCRETFCNEYITFINSVILKKHPKQAWTNSHARNLDTKRLRIAAAFKYQCTNTAVAYAARDKKVYAYVTRGLNNINILEKYLGWTRTRIFKAVGEGGGKVPAYVISGTAKWLRSSQLLSLYLLMFRLGAKPKFSEAKSVDDILNTAKTFPVSNMGGQVGSDLRHIISLQHVFKRLLDNIDGLFFCTTQKQAWSISSGIYGINGLHGGHATQAVKNRYKQLVLDNK